MEPSLRRNDERTYRHNPSDSFRRTTPTDQSFPMKCRFCEQGLDWGEEIGQDGVPRFYPLNPGTVERHWYTCPYQERKHIRVIAQCEQGAGQLKITGTVLEDLLTSIDAAATDLRRSQAAANQTGLLMGKAIEGLDKLALTIRKNSAAQIKPRPASGQVRLG